MSDGLDPARLTPAASLNRVRFTELTGLPIPAAMVGWAAHALLSARALSSLTARSGSPEEAARRFGERLGWLLVTLKQGDPASRAARPDWDDSYWSHWAGIRQVHLGGGIVSGEIGQRIAEHAVRVLTMVGMTDCTVNVARWPEHLPLVGVARTAPDASSTVVLDFGGSYVKRGLAQAEDGHLTTLRVAPRKPATSIDLSGGREPPIDEVQALADSMVATMAATWRAAHSIDPGTSTTIVASIASYVRDGQPLPRQGGEYPQLLRLADDVQGWLSDRVSEAVNQPLTVSLLHDGTAAAHAVAGAPHAAVIMLGTSLGVGFPPITSDGCRPLAPSFAVLSAEGR